MGFFLGKYYDNILIYKNCLIGKSALTDFENGGFLPESSESYELSEYFSTDQIIYPRPKLSFIGLYFNTFFHF